MCAVSARFAQAEQAAIAAAKAAQDALALAVAAYQEAGFGSQATDPLRDALGGIEHSLREVQS